MSGDSVFDCQRGNRCIGIFDEQGVMSDTQTEYQIEVGLLQMCIRDRLPHGRLLHSMESGWGETAWSAVHSTMTARPCLLYTSVKREGRKLGSIGIVIGTVLGICGGFLLFSKGFNAVSYVATVILTLISSWIMVSVSIRKPVDVYKRQAVCSEHLQRRRHSK